MLPKFTEEYTTVDKSAWGDGPWQTEPDKVVWVDKDTGYACMVRRSPSGGNYCGYVGVEKTHPAYDKGYGDDLFDDVSVHGGLTFSGLCHDEKDPEIAICHVAPEPVFWLGFDCAHFQDYDPGRVAMKKSQGIEIWEDIRHYRDLPYLVRQCELLASQLKVMEKKYETSDKSKTES